MELAVGHFAGRHQDGVPKYVPQGDRARTSRTGRASAVITWFLQELTNQTVRAVLHGISSEGTVEKQKGTREGGSASPLLFNTALFPIMVPLERQWRQEGSGVRWIPSAGPSVDLSLLLFCDNFYIISHSIDAALRNVNEMEASLQAADFDIKEGSLQMLATFSARRGKV